MRTDEMLDGLVKSLQVTCGDLFAACKANGVSLHFVTNWCKDDEKVKERIEEARNIGYMGLEHAAIKRAVHGVSKGVYYRGERIDEETVYSDGLLVKLLEAKLPDFKKGDDGGNTYNGPVQINNMPRAETFQQWLEMAQQTKTTQSAIEAQKQLTSSVIDAEYEDIPDKLEGLRL